MSWFTLSKMLLLKKKLNTLGHLANIKNAVILLVLLIAFDSIGVNAAPVSDIGENGNINPTIDLKATPAKKPVDIVIMTDYTGMKLTALNTQINALKAQFSAVNADPVFHIVSDVKNVGTQNDEVYSFVRYGRFFYTVSSYKYYLNYGIEIDEAPYTEELPKEWERITWLKSQISNLPARSPRNVYFTKSALQIKKDADENRKWYDVTIKCSNDPSKIEDGIVKEYIYNRYLTTNSHEHIYGTILSEWATVDSEWTMEGKVSDVSYDIYSFDFDKLSQVPLRTGSDRHMIFLSDGVNKDYSQSAGNYFNFGDMTDTLKEYVNNNKFSLYGVVPEDARDRTLNPDKIAKILPFGDTTLFYMRNGDVAKLGDIDMASLFAYGSKMYPDTAIDIGDVKEVIDTYGNTYYWMQDGTIKYFSKNSNEIETYTGLTDIAKLYYYKRFYALDSSGKIYELDIGGNTATCYNNTVIITDILYVQNKAIFITASGVPYIEYYMYDSSLKVFTHKLLRRLQIKTYDAGTNTETLSYMPALKDADSFTARAMISQLSPMIFLYKTGKIQQFSYFDFEVLYSGTNDRYRSYVDYVYYDENSIMETGVQSIESCNTGIFIYKTDGTVKLLNCDYVESIGYDDHDRKITYMKPFLKNSTVSVPLMDIRETKRTEHDYYFLTDSDNDTYLYYGTYQCLQPAIGTTVTKLGKVKKIVETTVSPYKYIFILYEDGRIRQLKYYNSISSLDYKLYYSNTLLSYTDVSDISASSKNAYILKEDGHVLGMGVTDYGQLGTKGLTSTVFIDPFSTTLTFDTTKTYYSLLDIFNQAGTGLFYNTGAYATAFNDIYSKYSSCSGSSNMYVLLGDDIKYESAYDDYESDLEYSRKWSIAHDPTYFDNSMGLSAYHNPAGFTTSPPVKLDKTGKYVINLKARDNPKADNRFDIYRLWSLGDQNLTVYIHRKPVAMQKVTITSNGDGTYTVKAMDVGSYDLDHSISRTDKGIAAREWRWRESTSTVWTVGQMNKSDCNPEKSYITQLRVKDLEGVWSDYNTITIDKNNPPVALFTIDKNLIKTSELLKVKDQSFPQSFSTIAKWNWVVKKLNTDGSVPSTNLQSAQFTTSNAGTGSLAGYDANVKTNYSSNGVGYYRIYLRAKDSNGLWSDGGTDSASNFNNFYSQDITVDTPPKASFTAANSILRTTDLLKLTDTSTASTISSVMQWHWIVKKLNSDGSVPSSSLQDAQFTTHNAGTGTLAGYDSNVKTDYSSSGVGTYRIYLRVKNSNGMWSDGGTDAAPVLGSFFYRDIVVDVPPMASFTILKNPMECNNILKLKDTSKVIGVSEINRWHWIVKKLDPDGGIPDTVLQDAQFANSNSGTGALKGYDDNVRTDYSVDGPGIYRIYLRVRNSNGMWSDGGTDSTTNSGGLFYRDIIVLESFKIANFRVVKVRDLHLESYYYNPDTGQYEDKPMGVNNLAVDRQNFGGIVDGLTKGYLFEFEIDTVNFNDSNDTIIITPHFYTCDSYGRDPEERDLYWENSWHEILKAGEGGHAAWATVELGMENRIAKGENKASWRGSYLIPGTAWAVPGGTSKANAVSSRINRDIIVSFEIKGYKEGVMKYDYNLKQWPVERTVVKQPYEIGDVIRYSYLKCNLDDNNVIINRP